jgi:hypothetical protein
LWRINGTVQSAEDAMPDSIRLTRQELYDRVWSTPLAKLGPELGMSGRGLAKLCAREGVPVPNRGWWAKKEFGWNPTQAKLPPRRDGQSESVEFDLCYRGSGDVENGELAPVPVPVALDKPHPLVADTLKASRKAKQQPDRTLMLHGPGGVTLDVSRTALDRSLRIVEALIRALEAKGCTVRAAKGAKETSAFIKDRDAIGFSLEEIITRTEKPLSVWRLKDKERHPWRYPIYEYEPSGQLVLRVDLPFWRSGRRTRWSDGSRQRLEALLPRVVQDIESALEAAKLQREERERAAQEAERQRQEQLRLRLEKFQNDRRTKIIHGRITLWRDVRSMKVWLEEVRAHAYEGMNVAFRQRWIGWIEKYLAEAELEAVRFPPFEQEPTHEEQRQYGLWGW